ncbi:mechanosensitive ion channel family protein [bacterium]|nr:mechanosensitive ion channel family protein [bacterium]
MNTVLFSFYALTILSGAFFLLRRLLSRISVRQKELERQIEKRSFQSVETESPLEKPKATSQRRALHHVRLRMASFRRILFVVFAVLCLLALTVPFLAPTSATYLSFSLGTLTVVLGFAARQFIGQIIAGFVLSLSQTIRVGDTVIVDGKYGTVDRLDFTSVVIRVWDWTRYVIPNEVLLAKEFTNLSLVDTYQWAHVEFSVAPNADIDRIEKIASDAMKGSSVLQNFEEPSFWVMEMNPDTIRCWIAGWAQSPREAWTLRDETRKELIRQFREHRIPTQLSRTAYLSEDSSAPFPPAA